MKGRLTLDIVNAFVDIYNSAINKKYLILKKPKNFYKVKKDLDRYIEWKAQECEDTKGDFF